MSGVTRTYGTVGGSGSELPVVALRASAPGPVAAVGANIHGDEATGIGIVHQLSDWLGRHLQRGEVFLYPSLNPRGLEAATRQVPGDDLDPNRAFPGSRTGSVAERQASRIWRDLTTRDIDVYVDLHTDAPVAIPYAIVDRVVAGSKRREMSQRCIALAEATGLTTLREYPDERYLRFDLQRSLPGALVNQRQIPALTIEIGPRRCIDPRAVDVGTAATLGVLTTLGLCDAPAPPHASRVGGGPWRREGGPRCTRSGVLVPLIPPGQLFARGDAIAEVRALAGPVRERILARFDGFVVAWPERTLVSVGTTTGTLAMHDAS